MRRKKLPLCLARTFFFVPLSSERQTISLVNIIRLCYLKSAAECATLILVFGMQYEGELPDAAVNRKR